jgi:hypothetical protein
MKNINRRFYCTDHCSWSTVTPSAGASERRCFRSADLDAVVPIFRPVFGIRAFSGISANSRIFFYFLQRLIS